MLSAPGDAVDGVDYDVAGRIDMALLARVLPFGDYDFYLCGPTAFTQALYDGLRGLNVADDRIHAETSGPRRWSGACRRTPRRHAAACVDGASPGRLPERVEGGALDAGFGVAAGTRRGPRPQPGVQLQDRDLRHLQDQAPQGCRHLREGAHRALRSRRGADLLGHPGRGQRARPSRALTEGDGRGPHPAGSPTVLSKSVHPAP